MISYLNTFQYETIEKEPQNIKIDKKPKRRDNIEYIISIMHILPFTRRCKKPYEQIKHKPTDSNVIECGQNRINFVVDNPKRSDFIIDLK